MSPPHVTARSPVLQPPACPGRSLRAPGHLHLFPKSSQRPHVRPGPDTLKTRGHERTRTSGRELVPFPSRGPAGRPVPAPPGGPREGSGGQGRADASSELPSERGAGVATSLSHRIRFQLQQVPVYLLRRNTHSDPVPTKRVGLFVFLSLSYKVYLYSLDPTLIRFMMVFC